MKVIKNIIFISTVFFINTSYSCLIKSYPKLVIFEKVLKANEIIKETNCNKKQQAIFLEQINSANNALNNHYLNLGKDDKKIELIPNKIVILRAESILKENYFSNIDNLIIDEFKVNFPKKAIGLMNDESLSVECSRCDSSNPVTVTFKVQNPIKDSFFQITANFKKLMRSKTYILNRDAGPFDDINELLVSYADIETTKPGQMIQKNENLGYFKLRSNFKSGTPLTRDMLVKKYIVSPNNIAKVTLISNGLKITKSARPTRNGKIAEIIPFKILNSSKVINAKIIDFNKAISKL